MPLSLTVDLPDPAATTAFGRRLGRSLFPGSVVALVGQLGAGKTHLVRAVAEGLDVTDLGAVSSPTFTLIHEYRARLPVYHFDVYRLPDERSFLDLGVEESFAAGGACLIEWADRVAGSLPADRLDVRLTITGEASRRADLTATGPVHEALLAAVAPPEEPDRA
jgi:tRNA threonylcarbamoyladenosine biosynthesis protein TsaE